MATLATACWLALAGRDSHPLDSTKRFHWLISAPPLPSFSQRDTRKAQCITGSIRATKMEIQVPRTTLRPTMKRHIPSRLWSLLRQGYFLLRRAGDSLHCSYSSLSWATEQWRRPDVRTDVP